MIIKQLIKLYYSDNNSKTGLLFHVHWLNSRFKWGPQVFNFWTFYCYPNLLGCPLFSCFSKFWKMNMKWRGVQLLNFLLLFQPDLTLKDWLGRPISPFFHSLTPQVCVWGWGDDDEFSKERTIPLTSSDLEYYSGLLYHHIIIGNHNTWSLFSVVIGWSSKFFVFTINRLTLWTCTCTGNRVIHRSVSFRPSAKQDPSPGKPVSIRKTRLASKVSKIKFSSIDITWNKVSTAETSCAQWKLLFEEVCSFLSFPPRRTS